MTINVPIRPGAALNEPDTRRFVEDNIINKEFSRAERFWKLPETSYNKEAIVNILANYPWREYGYKKARWARRQLDENWIPIRTWQKSSKTLLLTDPATGQEIAEVGGKPCPGEEPSGRLLFAGDPHYAGVLNTVANGTRQVCIVGSIHLIKEPQVDDLTDTAKGTSSSITIKARDLAKVMVPEQRPQAQLYEHPESYLKLLGPWLADHPDKPRGRPR
jgi:hypothetical protein